MKVANQAKAVVTRCYDRTIAAHADRWPGFGVISIPVKQHAHGLRSVNYKLFFVSSRLIAI